MNKRRLPTLGVRPNLNPNPLAAAISRVIARIILTGKW